jgi:hypothetical protein
MTRIVTYAHRRKRPPRKKAKAAAITGPAIVTGRGKFADVVASDGPANVVTAKNPHRRGRLGDVPDMTPEEYQRVLSAFAPTGQTTRCRARLSGLQDAECDRRSAHVTKASRHRRHVLAHAGSDAQEISEFVVPPAIAPC